MKRRRKSEAPPLASHVAHTVETIAALHARAQDEVGPHVRRLSDLSTAMGQPRLLAAVIAVVVSWITLNLAASAMHMAPLDPPPFSWLQGLVSLSALLMTVLVLITQHRQNRHIEHRARLDLQINLLAEQKVTKLIDLVEELRRDMPNVRNRVDVVANEMKEPVDTAAVISALEKTLEPLTVEASIVEITKP